MENLIYNELLYRGFLVDVGVIERFEKNGNGSYSKKNYEVDFVASRGSLKYYIQSAYSIEEKDKLDQEEKSLKDIEDSFKKIIVTFDTVRPYYNENGFLVMGLVYFLLDEDSLRF